MREKRDHSVRTPALKSAEPRRKYFLVYEGMETEPVYFDALQRCTEYSLINPMIDMVPILRGQSKEGWSNPYKLFNGFMADLAASSAGTVTYNTLIDCIIDEHCPDQVSPKALYKLLKAICTQVLGVQNLEQAVPKGEIETICSQIEAATDLTQLVDTIPGIISEYSITYVPGLDRICFVIDRDKHSFVKSETKDQYGYVMQKCRENGFGFFLSNPNFEYWLLLHFEEAMTLDQSELIENRKYNSRGEVSASGKNYTEIQLNKLLPGFKKSKYDAESLMPRVDLAIAQEKMVCEDEAELEHTVGSRVGILIQELRGEK